jgi:pentatricopeptide repeat protein
VYSSVINCWARSGRKDAPDGALKLLRTMQQQYLAGEKSLRPDAIVYSTVISTFVRAGQANRAEEIREEIRSWEANNTNVLAKPER